MNNIQFVFNEWIFNKVKIPFTITILACLIMIIITIILVRKELKKKEM